MLITTLEKCVLFKGIHKEQLIKLKSHLNYYQKTYCIGTHNISESFQSNSIGIIDDGKLIVEKFSHSGNQTKLTVLEQGDVFGFASLYTTDNHFPTNISCLEDASIIILNMDSFIEVLSQSKILMKNYISLMSNKINFLNMKIDIFTMNCAREKIIYFFDIQIKINNRKSFSIVYSYEYLAEYLNMSKATLYRELSKLEKEQMIIRVKRHITVLY